MTNWNIFRHLGLWSVPPSAIITMLPYLAPIRQRKGGACFGYSDRILDVGRSKRSQRLRQQVA